MLRPPSRLLRLLTRVAPPWCSWSGLLGAACVCVLLFSPPPTGPAIASRAHLRLLPRGLVQSNEWYDVWLPQPLPPCQAAAATLPWLDSAHAEREVALALPYTVVEPNRLRVTLALTLVALALSGGDIVETGVYTGGCTGLMLRAMAAFDGCARRLWSFDSFDGLPAPSEEHDAGSGAFFEHNSGPTDWAVRGSYNASVEVFTANLRAMGALDASPRSAARLVVTKGFFADTVFAAPVEEIAFLRLDGDLFASTWDPLVAFYDKVVPGGYVYVDDYFGFPGCAEAVDLFRWQRGIAEPLRPVKGEGHIQAVYWRKQPGELAAPPHAMR